MNIIIGIQPKWCKRVSGTNQVVHQTNQVVRTTPKRPSENPVPRGGWKLVISVAWQSMLRDDVIVQAAISLGPRPPPFWSSVCVHNNTQNWSSALVHCCERKRKVKTGETWERGLGAIEAHSEI